MEDEDQGIPADDGASPASGGGDQSQPQQGIPDDSAGAAPQPPISTDNSNGQGPGPQPQPAPEQNTSGFVPGGAPGAGQAIQGGVKKIASLLMSKDAAPADQAQARVDEFKKQGANDDQANLLATVTGGAKGGMMDTWEMIQYQRGAFNAKQSFANAAFNGVNGKAPDINAAATAATQASAHILDGTSASFHVDGSGVTATVTDTDGKKTSYDMTKDQFGHFLDLSGPSQYDRLMQTGGVAGAMQTLGVKPDGASGDDDANANAPGGKDQSQAPQGGEGGKGDLDVDAATKGVAAGKQDKADADQRTKDDAEYQRGEQRLLEEGNKRFPWASQGDQRNAWIAQQRGQREGLDNAVTVATERGKQATERARITGTAHVGAAQVTADGKQASAAGRQSIEAQKLDLLRQKYTNDNTNSQNREIGKAIGRFQMSHPDAEPPEINNFMKSMNLPMPGSVQTPVIQGVRGNSAQQHQAPANGGSKGAAPPQAIDMLRKNPQLAAHFDEWYGAGSAEAALGQ